jgi:sulfur carrier protein
MKVTVKLFASLRQGCFEAKVIDCDAQSTVEQIIRYFGIPRDQVSIILVNSKHVDFACPLSEGDILALFPPVGGG